MKGEENLLQIELVIDNEGELHLKETAVWGKFLAIVGFIVGGLFLVTGLFIGPIYSSFIKVRPGAKDALLIGTSIMVIYLVLAIISVLLSFYLFRFANKMQKAFKYNDQIDLNESFKNLKTIL